MTNRVLFETWVQKLLFDHFEKHIYYKFKIQNTNKIINNWTEGSTEFITIGRIVIVPWNV